MLKYLKEAISTASDRTKTLGREAIKSLAFKIGVMIISFVAIPLTYACLGKEKYGLWATITSVLNWIAYFDLGMANGVRNRVAENVAIDDYREVRTYISVGYLFVMAVGVIGIALVFGVSQFIDWRAFFNYQELSGNYLKQVVMVTAFFVFSGFFFSMINSVAAGLQRSSIIVAIQMANNAAYLAVIALLYCYAKGNLLALSFVTGLASVIISAGASLIFYRRHRELRPTLKIPQLAKFKGVINLSIKFFLIQISVLIIYMTDNLIVMRILGPEFVAEYAIVYKLFNYIIVFNGVLTANLWSAFTDAYVQKDVVWIRGILSKVPTYVFLACIIAGILIILARPLIHFWISKDLIVPMLLVLIMGLYIVLYIWTLPFAYFLNGINKVNVQLIAAVIAASINIPLSILFARTLHMGTAGVALGSVVSIGISAVALPLQAFSLMKSWKYE